MKRPELHVVGDRFFCILRQFVLQCPRCGTVWGFGNRFRLASVYNPRTQFFRCSNCSWRARLGIVAWPTQPGGIKQRPVDTMPTARQLSRIRDQATLGLWVEGTVDGKNAGRGVGKHPVNALSRLPEPALDSGPADMVPVQAAQGFTKKMPHARKRWKLVECEEAQPREQPDPEAAAKQARHVVDRQLRQLKGRIRRGE